MQRIITTILVMSAFLLSPAASGNGKPQAEQALSAHIVMSPKDDFVGQWIAEGKPDSLPQSELTKVGIDETFYVAFLASGVAANHAERYRIHVDWKLYKPDGTVMFGEDNYARSSGPVMNEPGFYLTYPSLYIVFDKNDPPGKYRLEAVIKDKVAQTTARDSYHFELKAPPVPD